VDLLKAKAAQDNQCQGNHGLCGWTVVDSAILRLAAFN
jgi:hypothetical protein